MLSTQEIKNKTLGIPLEASRVAKKEVEAPALQLAEKAPEMGMAGGGVVARRAADAGCGAAQCGLPVRSCKGSARPLGLLIDVTVL